MFVTFKSDFCWFNPLTIPLEYPETTISANSVADGSNVKSFVVVELSVNSTDAVAPSNPI